jgi:hypothetical protein
MDLRVIDGLPLTEAEALARVRSMLARGEVVTVSGTGASFGWPRRKSRTVFAGWERDGMIPSLKPTKARKAAKRVPRRVAVVGTLPPAPQLVAPKVEVAPPLAPSEPPPASPEPMLEATPAISAPVTPPKRPGGRWIGAVLLLVGLAIAALAVSINVQTGARFGTTEAASWTFAGLSVAADLLGITLPMAGAALWLRGRHGLSVCAWATWLLAASMATLASVGFASLHIADTAAARAAVVTTASAANERRTAAVQAAQAAVDAAGKARLAECLKRGPRCRDLEHAEQIRMTEVQAAIAMPVPTVPTISDADPQVTGAVRLAQWVGLKLTAIDVGNLRLALLGLLPNLAGLVLAFGVALGSRR